MIFSPFIVSSTSCSFLQAIFHQQPDALCRSTHQRGGYLLVHKMATRSAFRLVSRRFSNGKVLSEEEKAAENVFIKKMEQEKLEKIARQGPGEQAASGGAKASGGGGGTSSAESGPKVSEDKDRNYAVVAGVVAVVGAIGWYMKSGGKKQQPEVQE
ncbi:Uncharacterized protein Rs2_30890 [Raphanus sativus]|uniref:Uncharacterized protein At2g27730, mitochondrial isoform X2 n=1 Tax=Raphanus sativus TaxID=3726 RepID=A0A9W3BZW8_RAPSA|nr:uncharacterized protein At2g27730, mitochondrial isoform X2 [Raphanus sativus]KAJ4891142.1 Uncharacterized protein Rs2_30890 [Raphanus sativus]